MTLLISTMTSLMPFYDITRQFATGSADAVISLWDSDELICIRVRHLEYS